MEPVYFSYCLLIRRPFPETNAFRRPGKAAWRNLHHLTSYSQCIYLVICHKSRLGHDLITTNGDGACLARGCVDPGATLA